MIFMYITLESDYALRIVAFLAEQKKRIDANEISINTGVSLRFSLKILRKLVKSGMIKSFKGSKGGYQIVQNPDEITLKDVIEIVEGEYNLSRCLSNDCNCTRPNSSPCKVQDALNEISLSVRGMLDKIKISSLI